MRDERAEKDSAGFVDSKENTHHEETRELVGV